MCREQNYRVCSRHITGSLREGDRALPYQAQDLSGLLAISTRGTQEAYTDSEGVMMGSSNPQRGRSGLHQLSLAEARDHQLRKVPVKVLCGRSLEGIIQCTEEA
jgi:hypothetical protein